MTAERDGLPGNGFLPVTLPAGLVPPKPNRQ